MKKCQLYSNLRHLLYFLSEEENLRLTLTSTETKTAPEGAALVGQGEVLNIGFTAGITKPCQA